MFCECYFLFFLWPPYDPAQVNGGSRNFHTWWTLSVNREVTTSIFSWSSLNYRVDQKWRHLAYFQTPPANFLLSRPNAAEYCNSEKKLLSTGGWPRPNSVEYGNSKTTTLLPSAKCTRPLFQGRTGCGRRPSGWHDIIICQRLVDSVLYALY